METERKDYVQRGRTIFLADYDFAFERLKDETIEAALVRGKQLVEAFKLREEK